MDVSIIIVNFNSFDILRKCIHSIITHTNEKLKYEIIVVDNNSEGEIEEFVKDFDSIRLVKLNYNSGFAFANNIGVKIAKGDYILLLNNDTVFIEDSISKILRYYLDKNTNVILGCTLLNNDMTIQPSIYDKDTVLNSIGENFFFYKLFKKIRLLNRWYFSDFNPSQTLEVEIIKGAFIFMPKRIFLNLNGFDERFYFYAEEYDLCIRALNEGYKIIYFPETAIIHLGGYSTDQNLWFKYKNQSISRIKIFQKHYSFPDLYFLISFHYMGIFIRIPIYLIISLVLLNKKYLFKAYYYLKQLFVYPQNDFKNRS